MKLEFRTTVMLAGLFAACLTSLAKEAPFPVWAPPGANIALGKSYTPDKSAYGLCADADDKIQLTDGKFAPTEKPMWWFPPTLGWYHTTMALTLDLGEVRAIGGLGISSEALPEPGVGLPRAILMLVSDDGKEYRLVGELIALGAKFGAPPVRGRYKLATDDVKTHGRYVQLVIQSSIHIFLDEVEVYEGKPAYLQAAVSGPVIADPVAHLKEFATSYAAAARVAIDTAHARERLAALDIKDAVRKDVSAALDKLYAAAQKVAPVAVDRDFRAIVPVNPLQAQVLAAMVPAYRAAGYPEYWAWETNRWAHLSPWDFPPPAPKDGKPVLPSLRVHLMQDERRGEAVCIANFSPVARTAVVSFAGLPGGAQPAYVNVLQAEYVAQQSREWDADALPAAEKVSGGWRVSLPAGMSRQLWLDFRPEAPGTHVGELVVKIDGGAELRVPLALNVSAFRMPAPRDRAMAIGMWDYTSHGGNAGYALNAGNLKAAVAHMQAGGLNAPWGMTTWQKDDVFPNPQAEDFDADGKPIRPQTYKVFDEWVKLWPDAKYYMVYAGLGWPATWGKWDPKSDARIGQVMKAWAAHIRELGIDPARIAILIVDETCGPDGDGITRGWARAIKAAVPEFKIYIDPCHRPGQYEDPLVLEMFEQLDIITPGCGYIYGDFWNPAAITFYEQWRQKGRAMGFYACAMNASQTSPTGYYRLQQWHCWKINKGGPHSWSGFWSYSDVRGNNPWNQLDSGRDQNWAPAYIDSKSVTDGKHWLAIFEGQQDYEYLLMLKTRVEALEKAGRKDDKLVAARKLLDTVVDETIAAVNLGEKAHGMDFTKTDVYAEMRKLGNIDSGNAADPGACDNARLRVLAALEDLAE